MIYLYWYLGIGAAVFVIVMGAHLLKKRNDSGSIRDILDAMDPNRKKISYRILSHVVAPVLLGITLVVIWPLAVFLKAKELLDKKSGSETTGSEQREFEVSREDLQERLSIDDIESHERVIDPLGAVPALPFGHLHSAWIAFLNSIGPDDAVWSYSANWTALGRKELREGYVIVCGESIGKQFQTVRKEIDDRVENVKKHRAVKDAWLKKQAD